MLLATAACIFCASELPKVVRTCCVLYILICKCASRYSGVLILRVRTSKSGPNMLCFVHFDLQRCFSLQRRAIVPYLNIKSGPNMRCFGHFDLQRCFSLQRRAIVPYLNIKSGPNMRCFGHFDLQMCFSLQRRAYFARQNFQKWSEHAVFCTF